MNSVFVSINLDYEQVIEAINKIKNFEQQHLASCTNLTPSQNRFNGIANSYNSDIANREKEDGACDTDDLGALEGKKACKRSCEHMGKHFDRIRDVFLELIHTKSDGTLIRDQSDSEPINDTELNKIAKALSLNYFFNYKMRHDVIFQNHLLKDYLQLYKSDRVIPIKILEDLPNMIDKLKFWEKYFFSSTSHTLKEFTFNTIIMIVADGAKPQPLPDEFSYKIKFQLAQNENSRCTINIAFRSSKARYSKASYKSFCDDVLKYILPNDLSEVHMLNLDNIEKAIQQFQYDRQKINPRYEFIFDFCDTFYDFKSNLLYLQSSLASFKNNHMQEKISKLTLEIKDEFWLFHLLSGSIVAENALVDKMHEVLNCGIKIDNLHTTSNMRMLYNYKRDIPYNEEVIYKKALNNAKVFDLHISDICGIIEKDILPGLTPIQSKSGCSSSQSKARVGAQAANPKPDFDIEKLLNGFLYIEIQDNKEDVTIFDKMAHHEEEKLRKIEIKFVRIIKGFKSVLLEVFRNFNDQLSHIQQDVKNFLCDSNEVHAKDGPSPEKMDIISVDSFHKLQPSPQRFI